MKRLAVLAVLSLAAVPLFASSGGAQSTPPRASALKVSASTAPTRDRTRPYRFTTTGRVTPPTRFCAPGVNPGTGTANCIRLNCPAGSTNPAYCQRPTLARICSGKVQVRFQKRTTTVSARNVTLRSDCSYRSSVSFRILTPLRRGVLRVRARFQGNTLMNPRNSATRTVRAG